MVTHIDFYLPAVQDFGRRVCAPACPVCVAAQAGAQSEGTAQAGAKRAGKLDKSLLFNPFEV